jgi:hypothetical protein
MENGAGHASGAGGKRKRNRPGGQILTFQGLPGLLAEGEGWQSLTPS